MAGPTLSRLRQTTEVQAAGRAVVSTGILGNAPLELHASGAMPLRIRGDDDHARQVGVPGDEAMTDTARRVTLTIPGKPAYALSPNSRCHWRVKHRETEAAGWNVRA